MASNGFITADSIIELHGTNQDIFNINIKEESAKSRSPGMEKNKVYYLRVKLDELNSPLQLSPSDTTSRVYDSNLQQKDRVSFKAQRYQKKENPTPNAVIVQISGDFNVDESEKNIRSRATENVKAKLPELDEKEDKFGRLVKGEMLKIRKHKKLCQSLKIIDDYFINDWCLRDDTADDLRNYMQFESSRDTKYRGMIQYERKLSVDEQARLTVLRREAGSNKRRGSDEYIRQTCKLAKKEWGYNINPRTDLVIFDGSENAGSPIIRLQIGLNARDKTLYLDVYDISHGKRVNPKTGESSYRLATADTGKKHNSGKAIREKLNYDTLSDFITPGSLILGMLEFKAVVSQAGVTLKANLTNELYVRRAKSKRKKKKVEISLVDAMLELGDNDMYGSNSDEEEEVEVEVEVENPEKPKVDTELDDDDDAKSEASDDVFG